MNTNGGARKSDFWIELAKIVNHVTFSIDGLEELMDTFEIIKETENPGLDFSIIPSMVDSRRKIEQQRIVELSQSFNITPPIRNLVQMQESISMRKPVFMMGKSSRGKQDYEALWDSLNL